ncbi:MULTISPECIES: helix-turn-helix domain-containing protein [unclassified Streptomyces]|uniref:helix-turn-helix domain-containing protein n=1 Tax=unclassified Streptomyces TaxID=2593676 RepID=UPI003317C325
MHRSASAAAVAADGEPHLKSLALLEELIEEAGLDWGTVLDPVPLSFGTGLPVNVVRAGLSRRPLPVADFQQQVAERLGFLRRTRRHPDGSHISRSDIARAAGVTPQWIGEILNGRKTPRLEHAALIEDFFRVPRGFLTATPSQALDRALSEKLEAERTRSLGELLRERHRLRKVAFRGAPETPARLRALLELILDEEERRPPA